MSRRLSTEQKDRPNREKESSGLPVFVMHLRSRHTDAKVQAAKSLRRYVRASVSHWQCLSVSDPRYGFWFQVEGQARELSSDVFAQVKLCTCTISDVECSI